MQLPITIKTFIAINYTECSNNNIITVILVYLTNYLFISWLFLIKIPHYIVYNRHKIFRRIYDTTQCVTIYIYIYIYIVTTYSNTIVTAAF